MNTKTQETDPHYPFNPPPRIGQLTEVYGRQCRIVAIHAFGTMDVEEVNGNRAWRLTGLGFRSLSEQP